MTISRRGFLKVAGASVLVLGAGGASWVLTRAPAAALAPWDEAESELDDPRLRALSYAILAPNPHNRQPWQVKLVGEDAIEVYCDLNRRLPQTDPFDRQITIGLGCFVELYRLAAADAGYRAQIEPFPQGEPAPRLDSRPIARVTLHKAKATNDPLWKMVRERRSNKEPFDTARALAPAQVEAILAMARAQGAAMNAEFTVEPARVAKLRALTFEAFETETRTARTFAESVDLMRIGKAEINANPDGIDIGGAIPDSLNAVGVLTRENIADTQSAAFAQTLAMYRGIMESAMGYVWLATAGNSRREQLRAGADWLRLNLAASRAGVSLHPVSQSLQEFPEVAPFYAQVHDELGVAAPARLQMLGRIGYGPPVAPSPRWPLQAKLIRS